MASGAEFQPQSRFPAAPPNEAADDDLLAAAAAGPEDRVLVVGGRRRADLLCAALRRGCRSALGVDGPQRRSEPADVVLAPGVASAEEAASVAESAKRALAAAGAAGARGGRLALRLLGTGVAALGRDVSRLLLARGFERVRPRARAASGGPILLYEMRGAPRPPSATAAS